MCVCVCVCGAGMEGLGEGGGGGGRGGFLGFLFLILRYQASENKQQFGKHLFANFAFFNRF